MENGVQSEIGQFTDGIALQEQRHQKLRPFQLVNRSKCLNFVVFGI
jgi:hypothetical protein